MDDFRLRTLGLKCVDKEYSTLYGGYTYGR